MPPIDLSELAHLLWVEADRTGNLDTLYAAGGLVALLDAATSPVAMPFEAADAAVRLLIKPIANGLNISPETFAQFSLKLHEARAAATQAPNDTQPPDGTQLH